MSSILKALKKLEEEKQQPTGPVDHASRYGDASAPGPNRPQKTFLLLFCGVLAGLLAAGGLMLWTDQGSKKEQTGQVIVVPIPDRTANRPVVSSQDVGNLAEEGAQSAIPEQKIRPQTEISASADEPASIEKPMQAGEAAKTSKTVLEIAVPAADPAPGPTVKPPAALNPANPSPETSAQVEGQAGEAQADIPKTAQGIRLTKKPGEAAKQQTSVLQTHPTESQASTVGTVSAPFQVMEIFYQPGEGSMAVVDDLPVMQGTVVNGVLVEKIFPDRVRFIVDGQAVEVLVAEQQP